MGSIEKCGLQRNRRRGHLTLRIMTTSFPRFIEGIAVSTLLAGCSAFSEVKLDPVVNERVEKRLASNEALPLKTLSKNEPQSISEALPLNKKLDLSLPPQLFDRSSDQDQKRKQEKFRPLTIVETRALALKNNLDLQVAMIDPKIAATRISEEQAKFDDLIFVNAKYGRKDTPLYDGDLVKFTPLNSQSPLKNEVAKLSLQPQITDILSMEAGITVPLRTGGQVTISSPFEQKRTKLGVTTDQVRSALRFTISQPLLRGVGIDNNVAGIRIARYQQQAVDVTTRLQTIRVLAAIDRAYWELYAAWGVLDVRRQQYQNAANNLRMVSRRVDEGLTAAVELNRAEIGVAERMEKLIVAQTKLKLAQRKLKLFLNDEQLGLGSDNWLSPETQPMLVSFEFDRERLVEKALEGRLELLELELKLAADSTKIDYLRNQTLPLFMLDYSYSALGRDDTFGEAYGDAVGGDFNDWAVGLKFELPLTNALRKSRLERAVQQRIQRLTTKRLRELSVRREMYDALDQVDQNWQRILAARQNVILAGLNYEAELKQFREGLRTMTEVLEMLSKLGEAQVREVYAIADYQIALIDLAYATGTLLGYSKVAFEVPRRH